MKSKFLLSLATLALLLPMTVCRVATAATITDIGNPTATVTKEWGTYKKYQYTETDGKQTLFYGEYKPSATSKYEFVVHDVRNSAGAVVAKTVANIAKDYQEKTGRKVVMATNGDFFSSVGSNVTAIESLVKDGEVVKLGTYTNKNSFGFNNDGKAVVGRVTDTKDVVQVSLDGVTYRLDIDNLNEIPDDGELSLYTAASSLALSGYMKYKMKPDGDSTILTARPLVGKATVPVAADKALSLSTGQCALVAKADTKLAAFLSKAMTYGAAVKILQAPDGKFEGMDYVVGGWDILVENGNIVPSTHSTASDPNGGGANAPRTFIGMKADGTVFLGVLDGRQSGYSVGCTVAEEGKLAKALGAQVALELDGGGSSTFMFDSGNGLTTLNKPSDGSARAVCNAVLLVEKDADAKDYASLDDYTVQTPVTPPEDSSEDSSSEADSSVPDSSEADSSVPDSSEADSSVADSSVCEPPCQMSDKEEEKPETLGCFGSVTGLGITAAAILLCGLTLIKKEKEINDEKDGN